MSTFFIKTKNGVKTMHPVQSRSEYLALRGSKRQKSVLAAVRAGKESEKHRLVQMNYSCLPNGDGTLKGTKRLSTTVGMDIDHIAAGEMDAVRDVILAKREELGLLLLEKSARGQGYHLVFRRRAELSQEDNLRWASDLLGVPYDKGAKDITRVFFSTTDAAEDLLWLSDEIFTIEECSPTAPSGPVPNTAPAAGTNTPACGMSPLRDSHPSPLAEGQGVEALPASLLAFDLCARQAGLNPDSMDIWGEHNWHTNLMAVLSVGAGKLMSREQMEAVVATRLPNYSKTEDCGKLIKYFYSKYDAGTGFMNAELRSINARMQRKDDGDNQTDASEPDDDVLAKLNSRLSGIRMPRGISDSVEAVGTALSLPVVTAVCPAIGMLATGVQLDVHGQKNTLNLISYIAGDFASGKGNIDPVMEAWLSEVKAVDKMYHRQEDDWRARKRAARNKEEQPEEPKLPVRCLPLNNTVANLAERLANTGEKHAFSFTPEADTVAQKWRSTMSDFSVMLRQSYDGSSFEREARSAEAVNVHIDRLLWNVTMCGTPDALYRVVTNCTDGLQSRIAIARTPDNTFAPLDSAPRFITDRQKERIRQVAHLLPLMQGTAVLPKLEERGREWLEGIRIETMKNDDKVKARQRFRTCVTAQRMTCCVMLCDVADRLIREYGVAGAEHEMKERPDLWRTLLEEAQTPEMLDTYDVIADYLMTNALHFFRDRIETAFNSRAYAGSGEERVHGGKNDTIFGRLDAEFTNDGVYQECVSVKGAGITRNSVRMMLKNWRRQGLIVMLNNGRYRKIETLPHSA